MNKLVRPVRRSLGVLMAIALCLGTSAIWGSPAQAGDVTPGPIKTSSNFELTQLSIVQTVRDAGGKLVPAGEDKTMQVYHTARLSFDWKAPSPAKKGMSFTVSLPETLRGIVGKLTFEYTTCDITADGATMKCVLNDKADGLNQVSGHIDLALDVKKATREKTATVKIDGKAVPIDLPGPGGINPEPSKPTGTRKDGWQVTSDMKNRPNAVNWRIFFSGNTSYEIVDSRVGNNAFIRWWCVKGQDANVAEGRYGEGGVRPAGTLNVKKKSDGTSIANTDPMNRSGLLHEGIVITPPALDYACGIDIIDWDALSSGGVAVNKTDNTAIINGRQYGATAIRKQSGGGSDQGYPYPHIDIVKKDAAGNDANTDAVELAGKNLDAQGVGSTDLKFTVKNDSSVEDLKQVVVTDTTSGSGTVESMACTFPGEKAPTAGVYDAASKKWTVKWAASFANNPQLLKTGVSFPCTARLTGVTLDQVHTDNSTVAGIGAKTGTAVKDEDPYKAKVPPRPSIDIEKADESGRDADTAGESAMLPNGSTRLSFTVRNTSGEAEKNVVVKDVVAKGGKVSNLSCTFPDGSTASDPQGAQVRWEKSFAAQPAVFAKGASFTCSADLSGVPVRTGESGSTHQDTASVEADGAISGLHTSDTDPYNAHRPPEPGISVDKKDKAGNAADTADAGPLLARGQTDLVFTVRNSGADPLKGVEVVDETTTDSGTVESMQCTFPGENAPTAGVYDAKAKKWTVKWAASFGQNPKTFAVGGSFGCTARLTGVAATVHTDKAIASATGALSGKGVKDENPYNAKPPSPKVSIVKKDAAGNDANTDPVNLLGKNLDSDGKGSTDLKFTVTNPGTEDLKQVVVTDTTSGSGTVESMACTFPGEKAPTAGVYDAASKKWTVKWDASWKDADPAAFAAGASFPCTAKLTGVTADQVHTDTSSVEGVGYGSGKNVNAEDPYKAKVPPRPSIDIEKADESGRDADTAGESAMLPNGSTRLSFTVRNTSGEAEKNVVVKDVVAKGGKVSNLSCTFPDGSTASDPQGAQVRWEKSFAAQPAVFAKGASFTCSADLSGVPVRTGESGSTHQDTASVEADGAISGLHTSDTDPYNAHRPPEPKVKIVKKDAAGNDADTEKDAVALPGGQTDLVFDVRNPGPEALHDIVVSDTTSTESGTVESMQCTFPGENAPTAGVYDAKAKKWTVKWAASFGQNPKTFAVGGSFGCTARLTGVAATVHTDTAAVDGKGAVSTLGVHDDNPYNGLPPKPGISVDKKDKAGNAADTADTAPVLPRAQAELAFTVRNSGADPLKEVEVVDETTTDSGTVESMQCTFPGENAPTAGVYDAKAKKWTVKWAASFGQNPKTFAVGGSFGCTARLTGVAATVHTDKAIASATGALSGKGVKDENPYNAKPPSPKVSIVKKDAAGNDADDPHDPVRLASGTADLKFTVTNPGTEDLKKVVVTDTTSTDSGTVESMACTFPGEKAPTAGVYDAASKKWTVKWDASWKDADPAAFAAGASFPCTAKLTGVTQTLHTDTSTVEGAGYGSGKTVKDENPYNAVPPTPHTSIDKSDAKGNGGDTLADAPVLETGQTDLKFKVVNNGGEPLREIVVTDETVAGSGKVESMACTFPGENAPTKGVYDAGSKKWTVKWAASFGDKPTLFRISDSFACTAKLTGVTKVYHTDTAKVTGTGSISAKGVTGENPYNALPKNPNVEIVKKDVKGRDADKAADAAVLAPDGKTGKGAVDLDFTVVNNGGEALKQVVVTDTTTTSSGTVESMACTFPGEKAPTAGVYDAKAKKWTVKWDASFAAQKPSSFAIGASFKCTAHLSGVTGDVHTDDATIAGVGIGSGKSVSDENPYNARVPGKPNVDIEKVDAKGNDADTVAESVLLPQGKTDLVFTIVNTGNESLRAIEVTDKATGSGKVSDLTCTFPDGTKGTRWEASFAAQNPARLAIGGSFTCTAKLTGVEAGKKHADTATVTGTGFVSGTGVTDSDGYHAHRSPDPTPKPTPSHPGEPTPSKSTPVTPKTAKPKPKLPRTGADVRLLGVVALGLAAAGGVVVAVRRGRKSGDGEA